MSPTNEPSSMPLNQEQAAGQLREVLTTMGTALSTWGLTYSQVWATVGGILVVLYALTWGLIHHKDPQKPGTLQWSLVRKVVNIIGSALATYHLVSPEKICSVDPLLALLGPVLAMSFSIIGNKTPNTKDPESVTDGASYGRNEDPPATKPR